MTQLYLLRNITSFLHSLDSFFGNTKNFGNVRNAQKAISNYMAHLAPYGWLNINNKGEDNGGQCFFEMSIPLTFNCLRGLVCVVLKAYKF